MDSVGGIQVGDRVLLRHGSVEYAALLKKHGFPPLRTFRVLEVIPESTPFAWTLVALASNQLL
eukprot:3465043-Pleurochrysis_carterae.AAC.1